MAPPDKADSGRDEDSLPAQSVAGPGLSARGNRKGISPCLWGMPSHNLDICGCLKEEKGQVHPYPQVSAFSPAPSFYPARKKFVKLFQLCGADDGQTRLIYEKRPTGLAGGSPYAPVRLSYQQRPNRRIWAWHLHFCYLPPVNGLPEYGMDN